MNSASYAAFTNTMSIRYTLAIDSSNAYIAVQVTSNPNNYAIFRKLNFANSDVNIWANKIACPASPIASWNLCQSPSIIDSTGTILYNLVSYDSIVLFFGVNLSTGAVVGSSFQSSSLPNGAWDDSETIYQYSTNIYMLVRWSTKYAIFTYSVSSSTFIDYKQTVIGTHFLYLTYRDGMIYFIGNWNSGQNTYTRIDASPVNSLTTNADIVATTATMVALTYYPQNQVELLPCIIDIKIVIYQ